jgi:hypothetical protein
LVLPEFPKPSLFFFLNFTEKRVKYLPIIGLVAFSSSDERGYRAGLERLSMQSCNWPVETLHRRFV